MKITWNLIQHNENKHKKKKKNLDSQKKKKLEIADSQFGQLVECSFTN